MHKLKKSIKICFKKDTDFEEVAVAVFQEGRGSVMRLRDVCTAMPCWKSLHL